MSEQRIYQDTDKGIAQWYFKVRGDRTCGPFSSFNEAQQDLNTFTKNCQNRTRLRIDWSRIASWPPKRPVQEHQ